MYKIKINENEIPLFKPLILFISGIVAAEYLEIDLRMSSILVYFILAAFAFTLLKRKTHKTFHSMLIMLSCFLLGFINHQERCLRNFEEPIGEETMTLRIDKVLPHQKHKKCFVKILSRLGKEDDLKNDDGKMLVYFKDLASDSSFVIGNEYLVKGRSFAVPKNNNPYSFDYQRYLNHQGIYSQLFLNDSEVKFLRKNQNSKFDQRIQTIRKRCLRIFEKYFPDKNKLGVLQAMVLGKRDGLGEDINQAFIDTGAIHVLAVSGLHVGILSLFITLLFKVLEPVLRISKLKRGIISVVLIWMFAMVTGGSAAVCRAALMFSLFYVAKDVLHRQVSVYNVLCGTALILLALNPFQVFQIGFQFSFLAVLSIVFFFPYVNSIIVTRFKLINYFYSSVALGIAAQILVFPLSIFYFNKFANSFLISSLFVVQFAMVILVGGLVLLLIESIGLGVINKYVLVPALDFILEKFEWLIQAVRSMPLSASENLWLDQNQLVLIYFCIISSMYFLKRGRKYFYAGLTFFFLLINVTFSNKINKKTQKIAYVYDAHELCMDVMVGSSVFHLGPISKEDAGFIFTRNRLAHAIDLDYSLDHALTEACEYKKGIVRLGNHLLAFANEKTLNSIKKEQRIDFLLVTKGNSSLKNLDFNRLEETEVILDGSLKFWEREEVLSIAKEKGLMVYDVKSEGAKRIEF